MITDVKSILLLLALGVTLSAGCGTQTILVSGVPGESRSTEPTRSSIARLISQLENSQYKCARSELAIKDTKIMRTSSEETEEEWLVSSCVGEVHSYMVTYKLAKAEALVYHAIRDKSGRVTAETMTHTPGWGRPKFPSK